MMSKITITEYIQAYDVIFYFSLSDYSTSKQNLIKFSDSKIFNKAMEQIIKLSCFRRCNCTTYEILKIVQYKIDLKNTEYLISYYEDKDDQILKILRCIHHRLCIEDMKKVSYIYTKNSDNDIAIAQVINSYF